VDIQLRESVTMATIQLRRLFLAGGFAVVIAAAPLITVFATATSPSTPVTTACPAGELEDLYTDNCVPEMVPNQPGGITYSTPGDPNSLPEVSGIPCTGRNTGECIGLEEEQGNVPDVIPHSELSSSP
jgi:hypothetical protein